MQRHVTAASHALLVACAFGASLMPATAQTSTAIEREVREKFGSESDLRRLDVTVAGRAVILTGQVDALWSKREAVRRAREVDRVEIVDEIKIAPAESDEQLADAVIRAVQQYPHYTVSDHLQLIISDGVVTLMGKVLPAPDKKRELEELVAKIHGVQDVQNQIERLSPGDDRLRETVLRRIFNNSHLQRFESQPNPPFRIIVENSVVTLHGYLPDIEKHQMLSVVRGTRGILRVVDELQTR